MALFQEKPLVKHLNHAAFDRKFRPGSEVPFSGIYRCINCGDEVALNKGTPFPPQNHHQHTSRERPIIWQLLVFAVQQK
jgi:hypothetical protein